MLLTLTATSLRSFLVGEGRAKPRLALADLPAFAREQLGLHGLNLATELLVGADRRLLENLRERADKAGCPLLVLIESEAQPLGTQSEKAGDAAINRLRRVVEAARILGCSAASFRVRAEFSEPAFDAAIERLQIVMEDAERLDINVLVMPADGLTAEPERMTDIIKKVGGFRIGTFPDFQTAAASKDPLAYLRRLTPYASAVCASTVEFAEAADGKAPGKLKPKVKAAKPLPRKLAAPAEPEPGPEAAEDLDEAAHLPPPEPIWPHVGYDVAAMVAAVRSVGYDGGLAIDYRGAGDPTIGIKRSRLLLQSLLDGPRPE